MVLTVAEEPVVIEEMQETDAAEWRRFLHASDNGCLFHDLDFLAYHPPGRHRFHHLVARQRGRLLALVPGGLLGPPERPLFCSPVGASVGGPVVAPHTRTAQGIALVEALQAYAARRGWAGLQFTLAPPIYNASVQDLLSFALFARGFALKQRWNCYVVPVRGTGTERFAHVFHDRQATMTRAARRRGVATVEGGIELLDAFAAPFGDTYARHGVNATHTLEEIADLLQRFPGRLSLVIARLGDVPVAGLFVMRLNARVAYTFYICSSTEHASERGNLVAFAALLDSLGAEGVQWLDAGPGARDGNFGTGVVAFKERMGAAGHCRDCWSWAVTASKVNPGLETNG